MAAENKPAETLDHADHVRRLVAYFEDTKRDYRLWWMTSTALAMHFGFYDEKTRHHAEALVNMNRENWPPGPGCKAASVCSMLAVALVVASSGWPGNSAPASSASTWCLEISSADAAMPVDATWTTG